MHVLWLAAFMLIIKKPYYLSAFIIQQERTSYAPRKSLRCKAFWLPSQTDLDRTNCFSVLNTPIEHCQRVNGPMIFTKNHNNGFTFQSYKRCPQFGQVFVPLLYFALHTGHFFFFVKTTIANTTISAIAIQMKMQSPSGAGQKPHNTQTSF